MLFVSPVKKIRVNVASRLAVLCWHYISGTIWRVHQYQLRNAMTSFRKESMIQNQMWYHVKIKIWKIIASLLCHLCQSTVVMFEGGRRFVFCFIVYAIRLLSWLKIKPLKNKLVHCVIIFTIALQLKIRHSTFLIIHIMNTGKKKHAELRITVLCLVINPDFNDNYSFCF